MEVVVLILFVTYIVVCALAISATVFFIRYYKKMRDPNSDWNKHWVAHHPNVFNYMKFALPIMISGFILIASSSLLGAVATILKGL
jgi:heme/copper-type cytochrome/quinol oxidase subunit 2